LFYIFILYFFYFAFILYHLIVAVVRRECEAVATAPTSTAGGCRTGQSVFMTIKAIKKHEEQLSNSNNNNSTI